MKALYILLFILAGLKPAISDSTLAFINTSNKNTPSFSYLIKDNRLRLKEEGSNLVNLYDQTKQTFSSLNFETGKINHINNAITQQRVATLNQQRLKKLVSVETKLNAKLKSKNENEQKIGISIINQLKYPELYGEHTLLSIKKAQSKKIIKGISCDVYSLQRKSLEIQQICMASNDSLDLNKDDYLTLRQFLSFNYSTQTSLMLAMGKSDFLNIDYQKQMIDGIPIEIIDVSTKPHKLLLKLLNLSREKLDETLFSSAKP